MSSNARRQFDENASDIDHLVDLREGAAYLYEANGEAAPEGIDVLFRSAVVLMVSHWEAYVEDICHEGLDHMVAHLTDPKKLPKELKKQAAKELKASQNEIAVWDLAGDRWKEYMRHRIAASWDARQRSFNTPKAANTREFIKLILGIEDIGRAWSFDGKKSSKVANQLDRLVAIRGEIAHRGRSHQEIDSEFVTDHTQFLRRLVAKTGGRINRHLKHVTGVPLFQKEGSKTFRG